MIFTSRAAPGAGVKKVFDNAENSHVPPSALCGGQVTEMQPAPGPFDF